MKQYRMLSALSGIFKVLGFLGIVYSVIAFALLLLASAGGSAGQKLIFIVAQAAGPLFGSLILLGLSDLFAATLEIVSNLRNQKESIARIEVKLNNLNPPA